MQKQMLNYDNGDKYYGHTTETSDGNLLPHGYGTMTEVDGDWHRGYYHEGRRHGFGESYSVSTQRHYKGEFVHDEEYGDATITWPNPDGGQTRYIGKVKNGQRDGKGRQWATSSSGKVTQFEGVWQNDQLTGPGKKTEIEGGTTIYHSGHFVNGLLEGIGCYSISPYKVQYRVLFRAGVVSRRND